MLKKTVRSQECNDGSTKMTKNFLIGVSFFYLDFDRVGNTAVSAILHER